MNEHLLIKVLPWDITQVQYVNPLSNEDSLYRLEVKRVPINQRLIVYGEGKSVLLDTTIDEVVKDHWIANKTGWVLRKQNVWDVSEESYGDKRRYMELMKNYYPAWFNIFKASFPEERFESFEQYHNKFMEDLNKHKTKGK